MFLAVFLYCVFVIAKTCRKILKKGETMKRCFVIVGMFISINCYAATTTWLVDNKVYAKTTCENGEDIDVLTLDAKYDGKFRGWLPAVFDTTQLDYTINGTSSDYILYYSSDFIVEFEYGTIQGVSSTSGSGCSDSPSNCYCQIKYFIPKGSEIKYTVVPSNKIRIGDYGCNSMYRCLTSCVSAVQSNATNRKQLFN